MLCPVYPYNLDSVCSTWLVHCLDANQMHFVPSCLLMLTQMFTHTGYQIHMLSLLHIWCAALGSEFQGQYQAETTPVDTRSMLVQEGDPPMGRPVILSKEATLLAQPPSAAWGSAGSTEFASPMQPSTSAAPLPASSAPVDAPAQVVQVCCTVVRAGRLHAFDQQHSCLWSLHVGIVRCHKWYHHS